MDAVRFNAAWDRVDGFADICQRLFVEMVLRPLGAPLDAPATTEPPLGYPFLHVEPVLTPVPVQVNRPSTDRNKYWDDPVDKLERAGLTLTYLEYFDWDQLGYLDLQYFRCRIARCAEHPHLVGREALVDVHHCRIVYVPPESSQ